MIHFYFIAGLTVFGLCSAGAFDTDIGTRCLVFCVLGMLYEIANRQRETR